MERVTENSAPSVWLAPMSGATDAPFRTLAVRFGAPFVVSEMTASHMLTDGREDVWQRTLAHSGNAPWIVQLAGRNPGDMARAAAALASQGVDAIDINMGCPARKVTGGLCGSALMREPELAEDIIAATIAGAGDVPVSLKMRLGWDEDNLNAPELAQRAEKLGVVRLFVHGRTRCQFYEGSADWAAIRQTVDAVRLPVIANGDISCAQTAREALKVSGTAGVMIGRVAIGQPWLVGDIAAELAGRARPLRSTVQKASALGELVAASVAFHGPHTGLRRVRKHLHAGVEYLGLGLSSTDLAAERRRICSYETSADVITRLGELAATQRELSAA